MILLLAIVLLLVMVVLLSIILGWRDGAPAPAPAAPAYTPSWGASKAAETDTGGGRGRYGGDRKDSSTFLDAESFLHGLFATDYYELCRTHHGILSQFLHPEAQIEPIEKREPIKSNGKSSRYLFEYELCMLLGVFSTCWAKKYERSEGWIYKR
jgi:hypothetical protein